MEEDYSPRFDTPAVLISNTKGVTAERVTQYAQRIGATYAEGTCLVVQTPSDPAPRLYSPEELKNTF